MIDPPILLQKSVKNCLSVPYFRNYFTLWTIHEAWTKKSVQIVVEFQPPPPPGIRHDTVQTVHHVRSLVDNKTTSTRDAQTAANRSYVRSEARAESRRLNAFRRGCTPRPFARRCDYVWIHCWLGHKCVSQRTNTFSLSLSLSFSLDGPTRAQSFSLVLENFVASKATHKTTGPFDWYLPG